MPSQFLITPERRAAGILASAIMSAGKPHHGINGFPAQAGLSFGPEPP